MGRLPPTTPRERLGALRIVEDDLGGGEIVRFLEDHLEEMTKITPPGSVHALDVERLRSAEVTVWSGWLGDELVGCGALGELDSRNGEIKALRTAVAHRGRGVASRILERILGEARSRGYLSVSLETGALPAFEAARALYAGYGFDLCGPFADYRANPNSVFMTRRP